MADITIVHGVYKPTYNWGAPSCNDGSSLRVKTCPSHPSSPERENFTGLAEWPASAGLHVLMKFMVNIKHFEPHVVTNYDFLISVACIPTLVVVNL